MYAHRHRVVDNDSPLPENLVYFSQYLQRAGYETAFIGKWHMGGHIDHPQPGFNHWVSFKGQGSYLPGKDGFNQICMGESPGFIIDTLLRALRMEKNGRHW